MRISVCTISLRHQLISLAEIARWAERHRFQGIELWGVHALNLAQRPEYDLAWLKSHNLSVPMISDYLPVSGERKPAIERAEVLCCLARRWGASKVRTFAGNRASADVPVEERNAWVRRMRELCEVAESHGVYLVVETHPNTLADTQASTVRLIEEIAHPALRINFDVIHVWEAGADPIDVLRVLEPVVVHMHLKNIARRELLSVFAPPNVYAPAGDRLGMVGLFEGAFDYRRFLRSVMNESRLSWSNLDASLEWFGPDVLPTLESDCSQLQQLESDLIQRKRLAACPA